MPSSASGVTGSGVSAAAILLSLALSVDGSLLTGAVASTVGAGGSATGAGASGRGRGLGLAATIFGLGMMGGSLSSVAEMTEVSSGGFPDGSTIRPRAQEMMIRCSNSDTSKTHSPPVNSRLRGCLCGDGGISVVMALV